MTIERARQILGAYAERLSDDEVETLILQLTGIAQIVIEGARHHPQPPRLAVDRRRPPVLAS